MTGSPVFKFNSHQTKKQKIQRKLNFVRDVPRNQLRLHIDNLLDSDKNSDSQDEKIAPKPAKSFSSLSSFVFENKKGVKRKLDFDGDDVSDEVSSFRFSNQNISLNGFHSRNSSLGDGKSVTISPSKHLGRRSSCTRSSIASTCRRRLFADAEPEMKKAKLESPVLCSRPKKKEVKLSLQKRFPGVPNSDAARSGLLLNLAFSKYNMVNNDKEKNVSIDFVGEKNAKSSSKKELLQYSSIKKDSSSFHFSPVFKAIKKVKRKLDLDDTISKLTTVDASANETSIPKELNPSGSKAAETCTKTDKPSAECKEMEKQKNGVEAAAPSSVVEAQKSTTTGKGDFFKNSRLRPSLRNEIFNLSKPGQDDSVTKVDRSRTQRRSNFSHHSRVLAHRSPLGCVKVKSKCDRIIVNKDLDEKSSSRIDGDTSSYTKNTESAASRSAKRWFDDSFYRGKRSDLRKSLFHRRQEAFLDSHIQRFLNDCAQAAELRVPDESTDSQESDARKDSADEPTSRIEDVESPVRVKVTKMVPQVEDISTDSKLEMAGDQKESSPVIQVEKRKASSKSSSKKMTCEDVASPPHKEMAIDSDFVIEDSTSQEINKHCVEEVELFIENAESQDGFIGFTNEESQLVDSFNEMKNFVVLDVTENDKTLHVAIEEESVSACSQKSNLIDPDLLVEEISSSESISEEVHSTGPAEGSSTPTKDILETNNDEAFDSGKKRKRRKCYSDDLVGRLERLICREKSEMRVWEYEMSKKTEDKSGQHLEPAVFRVQKMWKEFSRLILLCTLAKQDLPDKLYEVDEIKEFGLDVANSVVLIMELSTCPKTLTYSSIFRIHPPWNILSLEKYDCVIILRPSKVEVISKDDESPASTDLLPNVIKERQFCECLEACNCALPEGYQTVIQPLLYSSSLVYNFKSCRWKTYDEECFKCCKSVSDTVLKHKLFLSEHLFLNLRVLYLQRNYICNEYVLWHCLCVDEEGAVCCIVVEDEMKNKVPIVGQNEFLCFYGILPWKVVPVNTVPSFFDHIDFHGVPEIENRLGNTCLYIFVLSRNSGKIERVV